MIRTWLFIAALHLGAISSAASPSAPTFSGPVPVVFENDQVFVVGKTATGQEARFFTDTGGGFNALSESAAERLGLRVVDTVQAEGREQQVVEFPAFSGGESIPPPSGHFLGGNLVLVEDGMLAADGFLGGRWHADRVWEFDYPAERLVVHMPGQAPVSAADAVPLGFKVDAQGKRGLHFPRMTMFVAGKAYEMLLDTGATAHLAADAAQHFGVATGTRFGTSFIARSTFEAWATANPDWRTLEQGDHIGGNTLPMIEVPEVTIGRHTVGPVWFAQRPDAAFREWMSGMMDAQIEGAIGGSAFRYFRMVVDYPNATAYFALPEDRPGP